MGERESDRKRAPKKGSETLGVRERASVQRRGCFISQFFVVICFWQKNKS